jgi:hypothetical protein
MKVIFRFLERLPCASLRILSIFLPFKCVASGLHTPEYLQLNLPKRHFVTQAFIQPLRNPQSLLDLPNVFLEYGRSLETTFDEEVN